MAIKSYKIQSYAGSVNDFTGAAEWLSNEFPWLTVTGSANLITIHFPNITSYLTITPASDDTRYPGIRFTLHDCFGNDAITDSISDYMGVCYLKVAELNGNGLAFGQTTSSIDIIQAAYCDSLNQELAVISTSPSQMTIAYKVLNEENVTFKSLHNSPVAGVESLRVLTKTNYATQLVNMYANGSTQSSFTFLEGLYVQIVGQINPTATQGYYSSVRVGDKYYYLWFVYNSTSSMLAPVALEYTDKIAS